MRYVYLVANEITRLCKIGITNNIDNRIGQIRTANGVGIDLLVCIELEVGYDENAKYIENYLHTFFKHKRTFGEWFKLNAKDILAIRNLFYEIFGDYILDNLHFNKQKLINKYKQSND